jgi:hypothetical protein
MSESELHEEIEELKERVSRIETELEENPTAAAGITDIQSFIRSFNPSNHMERAMGVAYFLEKYEGQDQFITSDIKESYQRCRMSPPKNMSDILGKCENQGWVMRDGTEGQATIRKLTMSGLDMVEEVMDDGA